LKEKKSEFVRFLIVGFAAGLLYLEEHGLVEKIEEKEKEEETRQLAKYQEGNGIISVPLGIEEMLKQHSKEHADALKEKMANTILGLVEMANKADKARLPGELFKFPTTADYWVWIPQDKLEEWGQYNRWSNKGWYKNAKKPDVHKNSVRVTFTDSLGNADPAVLAFDEWELSKKERDSDGFERQPVHDSRMYVKFATKGHAFSSAWDLRWNGDKPQKNDEVKKIVNENKEKQLIRLHSVNGGVDILFKKYVRRKEFQY